jgi:3-deoxy-D-manno-octulosonic-acid transferase
MNSISDRYWFKPGYWWYSLTTQSFFLIAKWISPFNNRAKLLVNGQNNLIQTILENESKSSKSSIWFHVSSLGEFEQGKPVIEALKKAYPQYRLVVTFFSPSGYENKKNDPLPDAVYYLPFENKKNAALVIKTLKPKLAIWVKYDLWFHYLHALKMANTPTLLIAALFRPKQRFFKPNAPFQRSLLFHFNAIFCQNENSVELLKQIKFQPSILSGDTRYDRVAETVKRASNLASIEQFKENKQLLVLGSSYAQEEEIIFNSNLHQTPNLKIIIAPHFPSEKRIKEIKKRFGETAISLSEYEGNAPQFHAKNILIIDQIGLLSRIYKYADFAFIGGGYWENGLHNILEAACFGMPICFGPKIGRFPEAIELSELQLCKRIRYQSEFDNWIKELLTQREKRKTISENTRTWVQQKTGATQVVLNWIEKEIKL